MHCPHYAAERCTSCTLMGVPYPAQVARKDADARARLALPHDVWDEPWPSPESGFRNKAKFVVGGRRGALTLGILDAERRGVDIRDCGLLEPALAAVMDPLLAAMNELGLVPYDVPTRRGEAKYVIATASPAGRAMVRFVLRSDQHLPALRAARDDLLDGIPGLDVLTVNVHPEHKAVVEGDTEIVLSERTSLAIGVNDVTLHLAPRSFFQTNTHVAAALYRQAQEWAGEHPGRSRWTSGWDLYCGIGGFALHLAAQVPRMTGIELSADAVAGARRSAGEIAGREPARPVPRFVADDATEYALRRPAPDLVVVNPPRRGLDEDLCRWLNDSGVGEVIYSSCNVATLARDLARMPWLSVTRARLFDMFPQSGHYEVMVHLRREVRPSPGRRRRRRH
ncbi:MAG: methyltransferase domain-containing protein [Actinomycetales bacterium]